MPTFIIFGNHEKYHRMMGLGWEQLLTECVNQETYLNNRLKALPIYRWEASQGIRSALAQTEDEIADTKHLFELMLAHLRLITPSSARIMLRLKCTPETSSVAIDFLDRHEFDI